MLNVPVYVSDFPNRLWVPQEHRYLLCPKPKLSAYNTQEMSWPEQNLPHVFFESHWERLRHVSIMSVRCSAYLVWEEKSCNKDKELRHVCIFSPSFPVSINYLDKIETLTGLLIPLFPLILLYKKGWSWKAWRLSSVCVYAHKWVFRPLQHRQKV